MNLPRMPLHIGDYRRDTAHLNAAEHGAYLLLIMHYWSTGGLPDDDDRLSRIACMTAGEWEKARPTLAAFFKEGWRHGRIDDELVEAQQKYERRVAAGKQGGRPPKESNAKAMLSQSETVGLALLSECESNAQATLTLTNKESKKEAAVAAPRPKAAKTPKGFLPEDWVPEGGVTDRQAPELLKMRDWAKSNAERKADWPATWRNWLRRAGVPEAPPGTIGPIGARKGVYVEFTDPAREAWDAYGRSIGKRFPVDKRGGWEFPTHWPPGYEGAENQRRSVQSVHSS